MLDDRHTVGQVIVAVRLSDSDGHADRLWEVLYRWAGGDGQSDGLVKMADEQSDNDGQSDRQGKMVYRWSDVDRQSDRLITGLTGGVTDGRVNDKLTGWQMDWLYGRQMGMTDELGDIQSDRMTDGLVA